MLKEAAEVCVCILWGSGFEIGLVLVSQFLWVQILTGARCLLDVDWYVDKCRLLNDSCVTPGWLCAERKVELYKIWGCTSGISCIAQEVSPQILTPFSIIPQPPI